MTGNGVSGEGVTENSPFALLLRLLHLLRSGRRKHKAPEDVVQKFQRHFPRWSPGNGSTGTWCRSEVLTGGGRGGGGGAPTPPDAAVVLSPREKGVLRRRGPHVGGHGGLRGEGGVERINSFGSLSGQNVHRGA